MCQLLKNRNLKAERLVWSWCCLKYLRNSLPFSTPTKSKKKSIQPWVTWMPSTNPLPSLRSVLILFSDLWLDLSIVLLPSDFPTKILCTELILYFFKATRTLVRGQWRTRIMEFKIVKYPDMILSLLCYQTKLQFLRRVFTRKRRRSSFWFVSFPLQVEKSQLRRFPHRDHERLTVQLSVDVLELHVGQEGSLELTCLSTIPEFLGPEQGEYADRKTSSVTGMRFNTTDWKRE